MEKIPDELIKHIYSFLYAECNHCLKKTYVNDLQRNVIINKYKHLFDDDYYMPRESVFFKLLCLKCLKLYFIDDKRFIYAYIDQNDHQCNYSNQCFCKIHKKYDSF